MSVRILNWLILGSVGVRVGPMECRLVFLRIGRGAAYGDAHCPSATLRVKSVRYRAQNSVSICGALVRRVGGGQVRQPRRRGAGLEQKTTRRFNDAIHGDREGEQGVRSGNSAEQGASCRDGEVQRGAGKGWSDVGGRGAPSELERRSRAVRGEETHGD